MRRIIISILVGVLVVGGIGGVSAQQKQVDREKVLERLQDKLRTVRHMSFHPVIVRAVRTQNNEKLTLDVIKQRDEQWQSTKTENALQREILHSEASQVLKTFVQGNPDFNEAFATDDQGANVAMYPTTSDYWQGDEDKWIKSFNNGNGKLYIGKVQLDESTNTVAVQVSVPILDQGKTIGVLVIGVTQKYLEE
ncbi:MAG: PDC sensor domain-containing protein [Arenicellales bacterium]|jgi:type II secretory pathway pseudopilin PulG